MEQWVDIPGTDGRYAVSNLGRIHGAARKGTRGGQLTAFPKDRHGYLAVRLYLPNGVRREARVHQLVLEAFVGPCPDGMEARHLNGIHTDNRLANLEWNTKAVNTADRNKHGTSAKKLNRLDVPRIREAVLFGARRADIANIYGIDVRMVGRVVDRTCWAHV
jgi:hypothetical protein